MRRTLKAAATLSLLAATAIPAASAQQAAYAPVVETGRYTRVTAAAPVGQADPLATVVSIEFPRREVRTVGDAARYLVARTGYAVVADGELGSMDAEPHQRLTGFALPDVHRRFDDVTVFSALQALGGAAYVPVVDHAGRTVSFAYRDRATARAVPGRSVAAPVGATLASND